MLRLFGSEAWLILSDGVKFVSRGDNSLMVFTLQLAPWNQFSYLLGFFICKQHKSTLDNWIVVVVNSFGFPKVQILTNLLIVTGQSN